MAGVTFPLNGEFVRPCFIMRGKVKPRMNGFPLFLITRV